VLIQIPFQFPVWNLLPTSTYKEFDQMLPNKPWEFLSALMGMENIKYINPYRKRRTFVANSEIPLYLNSPNGRQRNPLLNLL
ncbi:MAG: hypothetical protein ACK53Y_25155, partial [bacterium]